MTSAANRQASLTFETALQGFLRSLAAKNRSDATRRAYETDLRDFFAWLQENLFEPTPAAIERADITEYMAALSAKGLMGISRARKLAALRSFFAWLEVDGHIDKAPTHGVETPRKERGTRTFLQPAEYNRMLAEAGSTPRDFAILQLFLQTGVRVSELCDVRLTDIDLANRSLHVRDKGMGSGTSSWERRGCRRSGTG